jgi:hypothetical protein
MTDNINVTPVTPQIVVSAAGSRGIQGATGTQGAQGVQGTQGVQGLLGLQGVQGTTGSQGTQGVQGLVGIQGAIGTQGTVGAQGQTGTQGFTGTQGAVGTQGTQGLLGLQGVQGTQGVQGRQGTNGIQGTTGTQGLTGLQGITGLQGTTGTQGAVGTQGTTGSTGSTGAQGTQGVQGTTGTQGALGTQGVQGLTGASGSSSSFFAYTIKTTTTSGDPGIGNLAYNNTTQTSATQLQVSHRTSAGTDIDVFLALIKTNDTLIIQDNSSSVNYQDFKVTGTPTPVGGLYVTIPVTYLTGGGTGATGFANNLSAILVLQTSGIQGATGIQGTTGAQGTTGLQGIQGTNGIQGSVGTQGTNGTQGTTGANGSNGTQGTQGLIGATGIQGATGLQGFTGTTGSQGTTGTQGTQGLLGTQGTTGSQGTTGTQGATGTQGLIGLQGITGSQGTTGTTGAQGTTGSQGTAGFVGSNGAQGTQGIQGNQGTLGLQGTTGATGSTGSQGTTGLQGTTGATGSQGTTGLQGTTGTSGANGSQGTTGTQGTTGSTGSQGIQGTTGLQGIQGTLGLQGLQGTTPTVSLQQWRKAASGGETTLSGTDDFSTSLSYTVGAEQVFINGVLLERGVDYTATTGTSITGLTALVAGDIATVVSPSSFAVANAIPLSTVTAKGDLITATGASTVTNLAVGADGSTLVANSSASTGVSWAGPSVAAGRNACINGGMDIWARGTSFTPASGTLTYTADRWSVNASSSAYTISQISSGLTGFQYAMRIQRNSGSSATGGINAFYNLESKDSYRFAGQNVIVSFYARAGSNFSAASNTIYTPIISGTGTDQNINGGFTGQVTVNNAGQVLTTSWQRFTVSGSVGSTATQLAFYFASTPTGTAGANDYFDITGVQIEVGTIPTTFSRAGGTLQGELAACRRYLPAIPTGNQTFMGYAYGTNAGIYAIPFDVMARVAPTGITTSTVSNFVIYTSTNGNGSISALNFDAAGTAGASVTAVATLTAGTPSRLFTNGAGYILFTGCEL